MKKIILDFFFSTFWKLQYWSVHKSTNKKTLALISIKFFNSFHASLDFCDADINLLKHFGFILVLIGIKSEKSFPKDFFGKKSEETIFFVSSEMKKYLACKELKNV